MPRAMFRGVFACATLGIAVVCTIGASSRPVSAATRHAVSGMGREPALSIGSGHGIVTDRSANGAASHTLLNIPAPEAIRERQNGKSLESVPSVAQPSASPAAKPTRDPFPDFSVPLRRHRMAMPDSAIPALGDLSY